VNTKGRHRIIVVCVLPFIVGLVALTGCGPSPVETEYVPEYAEVRFHIDWRPQQFAKESVMSPYTSDIVIRIAKSSAGIGTGYREHVRLGSRWVTMSVLPGGNYDVEMLCLRRPLNYAPIGYGIRRNLTFTADSTNYVEIDLEPIHLTLSKPDSVFVGDSIDLRLTARNPYMEDLSRYLVSTGKFSIKAITPEEPWTDITFNAVSTGDFATVWEGSHQFYQSGNFSFFISGTIADWGEPYWETDFYKAFLLPVEPAWSPLDFGAYGSRFTVVICDTTNAGF